jgi:hypothetical protein
MNFRKLVPDVVLAAWLAHGFGGRAGFVAMALTPGSFNQDVVVEKTAPAPVIAGGYTTASMDNGIGNTANSWYEAGYAPDAPPGARRFYRLSYP